MNPKSVRGSHWGLVHIHRTLFKVYSWLPVLNGLILIWTFPKVATTFITPDVAVHISGKVQVKISLTELLLSRCFSGHFKYRNYIFPKHIHSRPFLHIILIHFLNFGHSIFIFEVVHFGNGLVAFFLFIIESFGISIFFSLCFYPTGSSAGPGSFSSIAPIFLLSFENAHDFLLEF